MGEGSGKTFIILPGINTMKLKKLIINADGFGLSDGINRAIEECIEFRTVRSISVNVNFSSVSTIKSLIKKFPFLSVGCHLNPIIGKPILEPTQIPSLVNEKEHFFYKEFDSKLKSGHIQLEHLRAELFAQIDLCRELAEDNFTHIDCHMGKHRLPRFYPIFLEAVKYSKTEKMRTHKYMMGMESKYRYLSIFNYFLMHPKRIAFYFWNLWLRNQALRKGFKMPDFRVEINNMGYSLNSLTLKKWMVLISNLPNGISEFVVHPGYIDNSLPKLTSYVQQRVEERRILTSDSFRQSLKENNIRLIGYKDIN